MAMVEMAREQEPEARLRINIGNERPISAEDIGRLVRELGGDYRRQTGGTLVLAKLELGSTLIELADQAVVYSAYAGVVLIAIEATERLTQFYKFLAARLKGDPDVERAALASPLEASPARLLEIAANSGADLEIINVTGKTKEVIRLTRSEASVLNAGARERKRRRATATRAAPPKPEIPFQIENLSEGLRTQAAASPDQMETLVEFFVKFLKSSGAEYQLSALADDLDNHGLHQMASVVRRHIKPGPTTRVTT